MTKSKQTPQHGATPYSHDDNVDNHSGETDGMKALASHNVSGLPIPPVIDELFLETLDDDFINGIYSPFAFGVQCGQEWVKTVSIDIILEAATRLTINQQLAIFMEEYYDFLYQYDTIPDPDNEREILDPTSNCCSEISNFFKKKQIEYFYFNGNSFDTDMESNAYFDECDGCFVPDAPNSLFRSFEDGWTLAVRQFLKAELLAYQKKHHL